MTTPFTEKIGFIGAGNMARAILGGAVRAGIIHPGNAIAADVSPEQAARIAAETSCRVAADNGEVARFADIVVIATKPHHVADVCRAIAPHAAPRHLFVSICAGVRTAAINDALGGGHRVVRVMPNTPALIGCGAAAVAGGGAATPDDVRRVARLFDAVGRAIVVDEEQLDLVTGLSGSGPAYVFRFTEALIEAGTHLGLRPDDARALAIQTVLGAARMAAESDRPLHELRGNVTTKGGTTEAGLRVLEEGDFGELILDCVAAATRRSRELSQQ